MPKPDYSYQNSVEARSDAQAQSREEFGKAIAAMCARLNFPPSRLPPDPKDYGQAIANVMAERARRDQKPQQDLGRER